MPEARKATAEPRLDLYALAHVRNGEVRAALGRRCQDCDGVTCADRPKGVYLGTASWDECPMAKLKNEAAQEAVALFIAAQISPIANYPDCMSQWGFSFHLALRDAVRVDEERKAEKARRERT